MKRAPAKEAPPTHYRFMSTPELAREMNLSIKAIRALYRFGAPFIAKKSHPRLLMEWMARHPEKVGKLE